MTNFIESELANKNCIEIFDGFLSSANGDYEEALKAADEFKKTIDGYNDEFEAAHEALKALAGVKDQNIKEAQIPSTNTLNTMVNPNGVNTNDPFYVEYGFLPALNNRIIYLANHDKHQAALIQFELYDVDANGKKIKRPHIIACKANPNEDLQDLLRTYSVQNDIIEIGDSIEEQIDTIKYSLARLEENDKLFNNVIRRPLGVKNSVPLTTNEKLDLYEKELSLLRKRIADDLEIENKVKKERQEKLKSIEESDVFKKISDYINDIIKSNNAITEEQKNDLLSNKRKKKICSDILKYTNANYTDQEIVKSIILSQDLYKYNVSEKQNNEILSNAKTEIDKMKDDEMFKQILDSDKLFVKIV